MRNTPTTAVLPRSLSPLTDESLPGYVLRLAHRLDLSPSRVAVLTGLIQPGRSTIPASRMLALDPATAQVFAHTTRLSMAEVTGLTLISLSGRYPPLNPTFSGRRRLVRGIFVKENWVFSRASRYCPDCLAGDGSIIQQRHGGAWSKLWRLPVVFACRTHQRLLRHGCPTCAAPAHQRGNGQSHMLAMAATSGLHPAQCRARPPDRARHPDRAQNDSAGPGPVAHVCAASLDADPSSRPAWPGPDELGAMLALQHDLSAMLDPDGPTSTTSVGSPTTPSRYFIDLRILSCIIAASWPAARHLVANPNQALLLDQHSQVTRDQIDVVRRSGRATRSLAHYDRPPLDAATGVAQLMLANHITTATDPDVARALIRPLVNAAPTSAQVWTRQFLTGPGYCSPGLRTAIGPDVRSRAVIRESGIKPPSPLIPAPHPVRFTVDHIPAHLLPVWHDEFLAQFTAVRPRLLRRAAAARLAQLCTGGRVETAAEFLGVPHHATRNAITVTERALTRRARGRFDSAIDLLAATLNTATTRTDFGRRRRALQDWALTPTHWSDIAAELSQQPVGGRVRTATHWGDGKRILASVWIWVQLTHGEHIYAPSVRPSPIEGTRPGGSGPRYVHTRWPLISTEQPTGHYQPLREYLNNYATQLAIKIDG